MKSGKTPEEALADKRELLRKLLKEESGGSAEADSERAIDEAVRKQEANKKVMQELRSLAGEDRFEVLPYGAPGTEKSKPKAASGNGVGPGEKTKCRTSQWEAAIKMADTSRDGNDGNASGWKYPMWHYWKEVLLKTGSHPTSRCADEKEEPIEWRFLQDAARTLPIHLEKAASDVEEEVGVRASVLPKIVIFPNCYHFWMWVYLFHHVLVQMVKKRKNMTIRLLKN